MPRPFEGEEVFVAVWLSDTFGDVYVRKPTAEEAIQCALCMMVSGLKNVMALHMPADPERHWIELLPINISEDGEVQRINSTLYFPPYAFG